MGTNTEDQNISQNGPTEQWRSVIEATPDHIVVLDRDLKITFVNRAAPGLSTEELIGETLPGFAPESSRALVERALTGVLQTGKNASYYTEYNAPGDEIIYFDSIASAYRSGGEIVGVIVISRDITSRRRAEEALRKSQETLQTVLDAIPVRVFWKDRDCVYLGCNRHFSDDGGLESPDQIIGMNDFELGWREQAELYRADDQTVMRDGMPKLNYEEPQTAPDGTDLWLQTSKIPLKNDDGSVIGILGVYEDITERKRVEVELRESEQRKADAQRMAKFGDWELDLVNDNLRWSDEIFRIFEIDSKKFDASYEAFLDAIHPDDRELVSAAYTESVENRTRYSIEHRLLLSGGRIKHVLESCETFYADDGSPIRSVGTVQDITERVKVEEGLRRSQKLEAIGQLSGGIAHDFNNQLGVIVGNLELLEDCLPEGEKTRAWMDGATNATLRCADLTRQLLTFSRTRSAEIATVNLNAVLQGLETMIARSVTPEVVVQNVLVDELWDVEVDPGEFEDAVLNLVINARDAMPGGGTLLIETSNVRIDEPYVALSAGVEFGDYVRLTVTDTGAGMDKDTRDRVFEPFYTTKPEGKGTGLGLAMVYGFIERFDGSINVYSEPGLGTTLRIYLPRSGASPSPGNVEDLDESDVPRGSESILIVEDEAALSSMVNQFLTGLGYRTCVVETGTQAMDALAGDEEFDLLFSDVVMPGGLNGFELAKQATLERPGMKVLLTSGYASPVVMQSDEAGLFTDLFSKPYRLVDLARRIRLSLDEEN